MVAKTNCGIAAYAAKSKQVLKEATDDFRKEGEKNSSSQENKTKQSSFS